MAGEGALSDPNFLVFIAALPPFLFALALLLWFTRRAGSKE